MGPGILALACFRTHSLGGQRRIFVGIVDRLIVFLLECDGTSTEGEAEKEQAGQRVVWWKA